MFHYDSSYHQYHVMLDRAGNVGGCSKRRGCNGLYDESTLCNIVSYDTVLYLLVQGSSKEEFLTWLYVYENMISKKKLLKLKK